MSTKKIVDWYFTFKGMQYHKKSITFSKDMLIDFIGQHWYDFFFDKNERLITSLDYIIATAREVGKTYVVIAIFIYLTINDPLANFILTRKYGSAAGSFYEMFNQVLNDFEDKYDVSLSIKWSQEIGKGNYRVIKEINSLKGKGMNNLFVYGKTGDDKLAIFYNTHLSNTKNQIMFLRGADDTDGSRGLAVNVGYILAILLEEYSQEVDKGKLEPDVQITRYRSLKKSASRYVEKYRAREPEEYKDIHTSQIALANIWDIEHGFNVALLIAIPESTWVKFVSQDPDNNYWMTVEMNGIKYTRATPLANFFLYPRGSEARKKLVERIINEILPGNDDYTKAEVLGFTFPGFLKSDNPVRHVIELLMDAPEIDLEQLKQKYSIVSAEYGTDPGLRDAWVSIPSYLVESKKSKETKIYINDYFEINNRQRLKDGEKAIPGPFLKQMQMDFWKDDLKNVPKNLQNFLEVNMDMRATSIRDDFNYDIFPKEKIDGQCVSIPSQESQGFGLEQRPTILVSILPNMIFHPIAKQRILIALKTLELYATDKQQPHPRKGMIDTYDALCYAIVKHRMQIRK